MLEKIPKLSANPITERAFWDSNWGASGRLRPVNPLLPGLRNYVNRQLHQFFKGVFAGAAPQGKRLLELGCGGSRWLPYFRATYGCEITGLDYSPIGCVAAQALLDDLDMQGHIVQCDLFDPPAEFLNAFDFLWSNGLIEHFSGTQAAVAACAAYLKPGGVMITLVPNMTGPIGWLQRLFDSELYEKHVPLSRADLALAHGHTGLEILSCDYVLLAHLGVLQLGVIERILGRQIAQALKIVLSAPVWLLGPWLGLKPNRFTSPYVICVARKPAGAAD